MNETGTNSGTSRMLTSYSREVAGTTIWYTLGEEMTNCEKRYCLSVSNKYEACQCDVGCDLIRAVYLLKAVVDGEIFPYSLNEIVEDFLKM